MRAADITNIDSVVSILVASGRERDVPFLPLWEGPPSPPSTGTARFTLKHLPSPAGLPSPMPDAWARNVLISADGKLQLDQVATSAPTSHTLPTTSSTSSSQLPKRPRTAH